MGLKAVATAAEAFLGTVTSVSVTTANGVSGSVANPTTTPAITLTLGAITPTTIAGSDATDSTSSITGAFKTAGGLGVAKAIFAGTTIQGTTITATTAFNVGSTDVVLNRYAAKQLLISGDGTGTASGQTGWRLGNDSGTGSGIWASANTGSTGQYNFWGDATRSEIGGSTMTTLFFTAGAVKIQQDSTAGKGPAIAAGTATTDVNAETVTQTWNNAGVAFTGLKYTFTSTASDAASKIFDYIVGSTSFWAMNKAGIGTMAAYGSGAATFSAQGVISSVSDEAVKTDIRPFKRGLDEVLALAEKNAAITYKYNKVAKRDYGLDMDHDYTGFSANIVEGIIPEAVGRNADGRRSFSDRPVTATLVNAMAELAGRVNQLEAR